MIKYIALILILFSGIDSAQTNKVQAEQYFSIQAKDTFYYFLSNERLLVLSSWGATVFHYVDEIKGNFNSSTHFAVNEHQLIIMHNDSIFVYSKDTNGKLTLINQVLNTWYFYKADAWNYDFIIHAPGGALKLLSCNADTVFIKDDFIATVNGQYISYPYFVREREVYKYLEGFGYFLVYTIPPETDPGIIYWKGHRNCIVYHTWREVYPGGPLGEYSLKARKLEEPGFYFQFNYGAWMLIDPITYNPGTQVLETSFKYIILTWQNWRFLYYISGYRKLLSYNTARKFFLYDSYIFNYDDELTFANQSDSLIFIPVVYNQPTGVYEEMNVRSFSLHQNYPNPFNSTTSIRIEVPYTSFCTVKIYDILGNIVDVLLSETKSPGIYDLKFNASGLSSGIYYYTFSTMESGHNDYLAKKMIYLK